MIIVTGASGFIGSALIKMLNDEGHGRDIIVVDDFYKDYKEINLKGKIIRDWIHRDIFLPWFEKSLHSVKAVIHMGARTDTAEQDETLFKRLNIDYSKEIWRLCTKGNIPLIYASSAATYGDGQLGFSDNDELTPKLKALNPYGRSKLAFDQWILGQKEAPPRWYGLRFFNVFGPNEYHKGRMASVVYHAYKQIMAHGEMKLFRSHNPDFKDGEQIRDFVYVKDVVRIINDLLNKTETPSGIYNLGTGQARTFNDLVGAIFKSLKMESRISYIDTPEDIRAAYQYYTQAEMGKLEKAGIDLNFGTLEDSVKDYVINHLHPGYLFW
jgi:ADP-L-glycero-D-manno-heptose 6-epimerase